MMRTFYVRPECGTGYGNGDGTSYDNAWNGFRAVNWDALAGAPATLWVCGGPGGPAGFVTLHVEWSYLKANDGEARPHPRRESPIAV
ncbi:MAG TPA: hypothetical protein VEQ87_24240 [Burkholderiales bacterium]|nr:hypothetical protein [Burkholderiales bacterium]